MEARPHEEVPVALEVIGAGMGRTGTLSLKLALEMLGFGPCHHMMELLAEPSTGKLWVDVWKGRGRDWQAIYAGWRSAVDFPTYRHYAELAELYPEARVVLTVRDPQKWWQSTYETIYRAEPGIGGKLRLALRAITDRRARQLAGIMPNVTPVIWKGDFEGRFEDKDFAIAKYHAHIEQVKATIPAERLLVFRVADGWGPLCEFLGVPVPDVPFPRANSRQVFKENLATGLLNIDVPRQDPLPGYGPG